MKPTPQEHVELVRLRGTPLEAYFERVLEDTRSKLMNCNDADTIRQLQGAGRSVQEILKYVQEDPRVLQSVNTGKRQ